MERNTSNIKSSKINLIVLTEFHKQFLLDLGVNNSKVNIIPNFIETQKKTNSSEEKLFSLCWEDFKRKKVCMNL